jgi:hypothetical protein
MKRLVLFVILLYLCLYEYFKTDNLDITTLYIWVIFTVLYMYLFARYNSVALIGLCFRQIYTPVNFILNCAINPRRCIQDMVDLNTKYVHNFEDIPRRPTIWIINYPQKNIIEYCTQLLLPQRYVIFVSKKSKKSIGFFYDSDRVITIDTIKKGNYETVKRQVDHIINKRKMNVLFYFDPKIEYKGVKRRIYTLNTPRSGVFSIAKELNVPITPIVIDRIYIHNGIIPYQNFRITVGKSKKVTTQNDFVEFFKKTLVRFLATKYQIIYT